MRKLDVVQWGTDRLRVGPWRGDPAIAQIVPAPGQLPRPDTIDRCLDELATRGYRAALTSALTYGEQQPFLDAGFVEHERLHLLRHDLRVLPRTAVCRPMRRCGFGAHGEAIGPVLWWSTAPRSHRSGGSTLGGSTTPGPLRRVRGSVWSTTAR